MHNQASVPKNETNKLLWDFEIQTDHLILARQLDFVRIPPPKKNNERLCRKFGFVVPDDYKVKLKESKKKEKYLDLARELKKTLEHKSDGCTNCNWHPRYSHQRTITGTRSLGNKRKSGNHPNYSIIKICQNSEKSLGDLRRLAVTQTPVRNHLITLVWNNLKRVKW